MRPTSALGLALLALAPMARAVSYTQGDVTLDINGVVNGYFVNREAKVTAADGSSTTTTSSGISSGLLPGWINFVATAKAGGMDVKAHISFAPGINNNSNVVGLPIGNPGGTANVNPYAQIDTRNLYLAFGNAEMGTFKVGRDIGMFGQEVILADMTLLGVGGTSNASIPYNTTFGMIGHGYMYTGFQAQIAYTTPNVGGLQASAGIFQPSSFAGNETKSPGLQAMASYAVPGNMPAKIWTGMIYQATDCNNGQCAIKPFTAQGFELGAKVGFGNAEVLAYGFSGTGLGLSTVGAEFLGGSDGNGQRTQSKGYLLQGTYKVGATKLGINFGRNQDSKGAAGPGTLSNTGLTLGVYHSLNKFITLVGEFNTEKQDNSAVAGKTETRTLSLGAIMFF
ncbi:MAG: porin [Burkholderiales bacterium]|nr:porin [Burkholderiales bacterium]MDE1925955.1 porin [Burkholderiales bacterium]MDE2157804.1 porin [Burkholderiales bacterium]MDE2505229.1 porin [Burkholderiales bacterium]